MIFLNKIPKVLQGYFITGNGCRRHAFINPLTALSIMLAECGNHIFIGSTFVLEQIFNGSGTDNLILIFKLSLILIDPGFKVFQVFV